MTPTRARLVRYLVGTLDVLPVAMLGVGVVVGVAGLLGSVALFAIGLIAFSGAHLPEIPWSGVRAGLIWVGLLIQLLAAVSSALVARARRVSSPWRVAPLFFLGVGVAIGLAFTVGRGYGSMLVRAGSGVALLTVIVGLTVEGLAAFCVVDLAAGSLRGGKAAFLAKAGLVGLGSVGWIAADALNVSSRYPIVIALAITSLTMVPAYALVISFVAALPYLAEPVGDVARDAADDEDRSDPAD